MGPTANQLRHHAGDFAQSAVEGAPASLSDEEPETTFDGRAKAASKKSRITRSNRPIRPQEIKTALERFCSV
jgi:hypothetical protein